MAGVDEETAMAILFGTVKTRSGTRDLLKVAQAIQHLRESGYSYRKIGESIGVADATVRQYDRLLRMPKEIWPLLQSGDYSIDQIDTIAAVPGDKRAEVAEQVRGLNAQDTRAIVDYLKKHPDITPIEAKQRVIASKTVREEVFMVVVPLPKATYASLSKESIKLGKSVDEVAKIAIDRWLKEQS